MSEKIKIVAFAGSSRVDSFNKKLIKVSIPYLEEFGAEVVFLDLKDYQLPVFDEDAEAAQGLPPLVRELKDIFISADGFLISSPEYNGFFSGLFKNTIDWLSRMVEGYPPLECFQHKTVGLMAASPGGLGGIRVLPHVRHLLSNLQMYVIPGQFGLGNAGSAFSSDGSLIDKKQQESVKNICKNLVEITKALKIN